MPLFKQATGHHIQSKAQMRAMFASNPTKAEEIAHKEKEGGRLKRLPEKKHPEETIPKSEYGQMLKKSSYELIKEAARRVPGKCPMMEAKKKLLLEKE